MSGSGRRCGDVPKQNQDRGENRRNSNKKPKRKTKKLVHNPCKNEKPEDSAYLYNKRAG